MIDIYRNDPLRTGWITPRMADFIFRTVASCIAEASKLAVPTLMLIAGSDAVVDASASHEFSRRASPTGQLTTHTFPVPYHDLLNEAEPWRGQVLAQLHDWLAGNLGLHVS